ncbi:thiol reductant ABC exporter subunit CydC [Paenisporosarcina antarctica]|uniref:Thiol reductant ABC exporter subunit CydC n=1 Tax=Paenisporosarcina antarctica TaxID=417367 RepID=A0A4P6ZXV4_9BACL|nr:thiol reductant ABC exporter subunit CydC [Paenisporosarcina antarctica]QBP41291.1 thiol reductant ABC exporter subunit CydC [Paenisporosarcina antarctica]
MKDIAIVIKLVVTEKKDILFSVFFGFIAGIAAVGLFASSGYLISKAALSPPLYTLTIMMASLKLFGIASALSRYAERYFSHRATFSILSNLRVSFYERLEPSAPSIFQKYRSGDLLARIVGDVESLQNFFIRVFYPPIILITVFLSTILFLTFYSIYVAFALIVGLLLTGFILPALFAVRQRTIESNVREERGELSTDVTELLYGFRDLKIYQKLEGKKQRLIKSSDAYVKEQERKGITDKFNLALNLFAGLFVSWIVLALGAYLVVEGQLDGIFLAMLMMISLTVFENATPMAILPSHLEDSRRAATRLFSVTDVTLQKENLLKKMESITSSKSLEIDMMDVTFSYPTDSRLVLNKVSLNLPEGSKTAIVGPSGSGKSTLLQLLMKFYQADGGTIKIDGVPISKLTQENIWRETNIILQENHFFYGTIRDNLLIAKDGLTDEQMVEMLAKVNLESLSLKDLVFEKGENLSGGEKQRLAIARAMLKGGHLWLLDEPTSSVDALAEQSIYRHLFQLAKHDTLVLVSHRLTGLELMDQIIVMEQGIIIERGSFEELMNKKGYFYKMKQIEKSVFM